MPLTVACLLNLRWLLMAAALTACTGLPLVEKPTLTFAGLRVERLSLSNPDFDLILEVANPNPFSLPISHLDVELELNERPLAQGENALPVTVPAHASALMEIKLHARSDALWRAIGDMLHSPGGNLRYRLRGTAVATRFDLHFNFDQPGTTDLDTLLGRHRATGDAR